MQRYKGAALDPTDYLWIDALQKALKRNRREASSRYFQLASVDAHGKPRARTVVYRGLDEDGTSILFITDTRSAKVGNLHQQPVEVCWYFPVSREQFRVAGRAEVFPSAHQRHSGVWHMLSETAKAQFFWPAPGEIKADSPEFTTQGVNNDLKEPPSTFCVVAIRAEHVDHLRLSNPQQRIISDLHGAQTDMVCGWHQRLVNP